jgi:hypothetical protein
VTDKIKEIKSLHREAMELTDRALAARQNGEDAQALLYFRKAYDYEAAAAASFVNDLNAEPNRSVLLRSAASLALDCGLIAESEKLICTALAGTPPEEIAEELRDLMEQVHFQRHLELRGITLHETEVQMSISGKSIGLGIAPIDLFLGRVQNVEKLLYRTAERLSDQAFRLAGRIPGSILHHVELFATAPRASSFAVSFRLGRTTQLTLPEIGTSLGEQTVDEMLECLDLFTKGNQDTLKTRIPQEDYYNNFIGLAKNIAPDGQDVNLVGFTTVRQGSLKKVAMTAATEPPSPVSFDKPLVTPAAVQEDEGTVAIQGVLREADSRKKGREKIQILDPEGTFHTIIVPPGMMSDIVKPLWESEVIVMGTRKKKAKAIHLTEIRPVK